MATHIPRIKARPAALVLPPTRPHLARRLPGSGLQAPGAGSDGYAVGPTSPHTPLTPFTPMTPWTPFTTDGLFTPGLGPMTPMPALQAQRGIDDPSAPAQANLLVPDGRAVRAQAMRQREWYLRGREKTSWIPASYFALAVTGKIMFSLGALLFEYELYAQQLRDEADRAGRPPGPPGAAPSPGLDTPEIKLKTIPGALLTIVGMMMAVTAVGLFYAQARKKKPVRAAVMASMTLSAIMLIITHRILGNVSAHNWSQAQTDGIGALGWVGAGIYAYTVPNSLCAAESELGHTPLLGSLDRRTEIGLGLVGAGVTLISVWGSLVGRMGTSPYVRELLYILGSSFLTIGVGLGLTNYRASANTIARGRLAEELEAAHDMALLDVGGPRRSSSPTVGAVRRGSAATLGGPRRGATGPMAASQAQAFPAGMQAPPRPPRRHSVHAGLSTATEIRYPTARAPQGISSVTPVSEASPDAGQVQTVAAAQDYFNLGGIASS